MLYSAGKVYLHSNQHWAISGIDARALDTGSDTPEYLENVPGCALCLILCHYRAAMSLRLSKCTA